MNRGASPRARPGRRTVTGCAAAVAVLAGSMTVPSAQAAPRPQQPPQHCTLDARSGEQHCFGTFTEAVEESTGGRIEDAPASARKAVADSGFRTGTERLASSPSALADGDVIQGTFFDETRFTGDSLTIHGEAPCKKDGWVDYQTDLEEAWQDRISSVQPWAGCAIWLYPETGLGGERDGPFDENAGDIGSFMNDRTRSIGFS